MEEYSTEEVVDYISRTELGIPLSFPTISNEVDVCNHKKQDRWSIALLELSDDHLSELAPLIGDRIKLKRAIREAILLSSSSSV